MLPLKFLICLGSGLFQVYRLKVSTCENQHIEFLHLYLNRFELNLQATTTARTGKHNLPKKLIEVVIAPNGLVVFPSLPGCGVKLSIIFSSTSRLCWPRPSDLIEHEWAEGHKYRREGATNLKIKQYTEL